MSRAKDLAEELDARERLRNRGFKFVTCDHCKGAKALPPSFMPCPACRGQGGHWRGPLMR